MAENIGFVGSGLIGRPMAEPYGQRDYRAGNRIIDPVIAKR